MFFEITGFSQKPTALIQKDEGFRYKWMAGVLASYSYDFSKILYKQILRSFRPQNDGNCWVKTQPTIVKSAKEIKSSLLNSLTTKTLK